MGLVWLIVIFTSIWVYFDAKSIGARKGALKGFFDLGPAGWFWVTLLLWIVGFPAYLAKRGEIKSARVPAPSPSPASVATSADTLAQLEKLGELKQKGILSDEEFAVQKRQLLSRSSGSVS
jgi:hypothetical protein